MNVWLRPRLHRIVASILLVALLLHALVPAGFMPAFAAGPAPSADNGWLAICPASALANALAARTNAERPPTGPICHGRRQVDGTSAVIVAAAVSDSNASDAAPKRDPAVDRYDCPFAAGSAAALPTNAVRSAVPTTLPAAAVPAARRVAASARLYRLPPSRGPPSESLVPLLHG